MTYEEFTFIFLNNISLFIFTAVITNIVYLLLFRKNIYAIIDPLLYHTITSASGFSIVFALWYLKYIEDYYVISFLLTQISFVIGFYIFRPIKLKKFQQSEFKLLSIPKYIKVLYVLSGICFIMSNYSLYIFKGIPLLMPSRLEAGTGGFGIFIAMTYITKNVLVAFILLKITILKEKLTFIDKFFLLNIIIQIILSGSRSGILGILISAFWILFFMEVRFNIYFFKKYKSKLNTLVVIAIFISLFLFYISTKQNPIYMFLFRIVMTGDIYMMAYVNDMINVIEGSFLDHFLGPILAGFKLIDWNEVPVSIGQQLFDYLYKTDIILGPNARMNIVALKFFDFFGGVLYSFLIGFIISFIRNKLIYLVPKNVTGLLIYLFISLPSLSLETDIFYAIFNYKSEISLLLPIFVVVIIISQVSKKEDFKNDR